MRDMRRGVDSRVQCVRDWCEQVSTRAERQDWQDFREKHGASLREFIRRFEAMFSRAPNPKERQEYLDMKRALTANLGKRPRSAPQLVTVTKKYEWDMGHRLPNHSSKCRHLHGHRYVAEVDVTGPLLTHGSSEGMVLDFTDLKAALEEVIGPWDHKTMLSEQDVMLNMGGLGQTLTDFGVITVPFTPTAENMAREVLVRLRDKRFNVTRVRIYETPNGWAEVRP